MERLLLCLLLAAAAAADEPAPRGTPPEHDALGFPITFNDELITRRDVLRSLGLPEERIGDERTLELERDRLLMDKILQRFGVIYGIDVEEQRLRDQLQREIELRGGEAAFYDYLHQRGQTYGSYLEGMRTQLLEAYLRAMLQTGVAPGNRLLPYSLTPTPREVAVALAHERRNKPPTAKARVVEVVLETTAEERAQMARKVIEDGLSPEEALAKLEAALRPRAEAMERALASGIPLEEAAEAGGAAIETRVLELPREASEDPAVRFLQDARPGDVSPPLPRGGGGVRFLRLEEVVREGGLEDRKVYERMSATIHDLRRRQADALIRLRALDASLVRPERVKDDLRKALLARLEEARAELLRLGLH